MKNYILSLDLGSAYAGATIINQQGKVVASIQKDFEKLYPHPGWLEFDPNELWYSLLQAAKEVLKTAGIKGDEINAIGLANQRETTLVWNKKTGEPVYNAIAWQDKRTANICDDLYNQGFGQLVHERTGLILDAYFSASKIKWILDEVDGVRRLAEEGNLAFGTIDSWMVWKLTGGKLHVTDITNASRTSLFNIHIQEWDKELCKLFSIPPSMLPVVKACDEIGAVTDANLLGTAIPIAAIAGDQHASMFGHACFETGAIKNTYGSGCFLMMNIGEKPIVSGQNLITTVAWKLKDKTIYALEASVFGGSSTFRWLRDGLGIIDQTAEVEELAMTEKDNGGVYFVPAFSGLGSPYWDPHARGLIIGLSRGTTSGHIARASLEGVALGICDAVEAMEKESGKKVVELKVDGTISEYQFFLQLQTDLLQRPVIKPAVTQQSTMGAAFMAGLSTGFWKDIASIQSFFEVKQAYKPAVAESEILNIKSFWRKAVARSQKWDW